MNFFVKSSTAGNWPTVKKFFIKSSTSGTWPTVKKGFVKGINGWRQFYGTGPNIELEPELTITQTTVTNPKEYSRSNKPTLKGKIYYIYNSISATGWFEFSNTKTDLVAGTTWVTKSVNGSTKFGNHNITLPTSTDPNISAGYFISPAFVWDQDAYPFDTTPSYFRYAVRAVDDEGNANTFTSAELPIISKPMVQSGTLKIKRTLPDRYDYDTTSSVLFTTKDSITSFSYTWSVRSGTSPTSALLAGTTVSGTITQAPVSLNNIPQYNTSTYGNARYGKYAVLQVWAGNSAGTDLTEYFSASFEIAPVVGTVSYSGNGTSLANGKVSYLGTYTVTLENDWYIPAGASFSYNWFRTDYTGGTGEVSVGNGITSGNSNSLTINASNGVLGESYYCRISETINGISSPFFQTQFLQLVLPAPTVLSTSNTIDGAKNFYITIGNGSSYPGYEAGKDIKWTASWNSTGDNGTLSGTIPYPSGGTKPTYTQTYPLYVTATGTIPNWVGSNTVFITNAQSTLTTSGYVSTTSTSWEVGSNQFTIWFPYVGVVSVSGGNTALAQKRISKGSSLVVSTTGGTTISPGGAAVTYTYQWYELGNTSTVIFTGATFTPNLSSYMGKQYRCKVTASLGDLYDIAYTDYYMVVPAAPSYTLSQNGAGSFSSSAITSDGATHFYGTYTINSATTTIGYTGVGSSFSNVLVGPGTLSMTLFGSYYNGSSYIDGYASLTRSVQVVAAPAAATPYPEISRQQDYNYVYTTTNGNWLYSPTSYLYNWKYSTDGGVTFSASIGTTQTITLNSSYIGRKLYCTVTGVNASGPGESVTTSNVMAFLVTGAYPAPFSISSIVDATTTPVTPTSVAISSNSLNIGTLSWSSTLTSTDLFNWTLSGTPFTGSGSVAVVGGISAYSHTNWTITASGTESATVTPRNNTTRVDINWGASTNASSYTLTYTTTAGTSTVTGITNNYYIVYVSPNTGLVVNALKAVNTYLPAGRVTTTSLPSTSVTASPKSGTAGTASQVLSLYPQNSVTPVISRVSAAGYQYSCTTGTWTATEGVTYSYNWYTNLGPITTGNGNSTITLSNAYVGQSLSCTVTATNSNTKSNSKTATAFTVTVATPGAFTYSLSPAATTPGTPTNLSLSSNSLNVGTFSWISGGGSTDYSYSLSGTPFTESGSTTLGNTSFTFVVAGSGTETASVSGKIASTGIKITWTASSDAASYTLSYTDSSGTVTTQTGLTAASSPFTIPYVRVNAITLTAINTSGSTVATTSNTFPYITSTLTGTAATKTATLLLYPQNSVAPVVSRTYNYAYEYSCTNGTWTAASGISYSYAWYDTGTGGAGLIATTQTVTVTSANVGRNLHCIVTATNTNGGSTAATSNTLGVTQAIPSLPTSLTATTDSSSGVTLTFSGSSNAASYDIFWNTLATAAPTSAATPDFLSKSSPYTDTTIAADSTRYYWVRGKNTAGTSAWYPTVGVTGTRTVAGVAPSTPTNVTGTDNVSPTGGTFSWTASTGTTPITYYYTINAFTVGPVATGNTTQTSVEFLTAGSHNISVYASNSVGISTTASSSYVNFTTKTTAPAVPTGVSTSSSGVVSWNPVTNATSYQVEYYVASSSTGFNAYGPSYATVSPGTATTYSIIYPTINGVYLNYARAAVQAINSNGSSAYSAFSPASGYV